MTTKAKEPRVDFVRDVTRASRLLKKVAMGDMTLTDLLLGTPEDNQPTVEKTEARADDAHCALTKGCICVNGHNGGCVIDATVEESTP